ncbi:leucine-rich repeat domain-containing protein [uncultured Porphyromonas sp.]|uniref:leucine-rich repeat domain-containing protein n=1 Tax=uncultured Porphyromonas sp. TaxID=159274 RepID=UPI00260CAC6C|nr:leucine-rich repeat domain-containing protein [uncultured Porphyromonas sp.]
MIKQLRIWLFVLLSTLLTSTSLPAEGIIIMTTSKTVGEEIFLKIEANGNVTIEGIKEAPETGDKFFVYTLTSQTITIRGDVTTLDCSNNQLTSLDVSGCTALAKLSCSRNQLTSLDVSKNPALTTLWCSDNQLTSLDVSKNPALTQLDCSSNQLTNLDVSDCTALTKLGCYENQLTNLNASGCTALTWLDCSWNQLTSLNVSGYSALGRLSCSNNQLTSLDVSGCTSLTTLDCSWNQLTNLNVSGCSALTWLDCSWNQNQLTSLDVSKNTALTTLDCYWNQLTSLNASGCAALTTLNCSDNQLTSLDVSDCTSLTTLNCFNNQLTSLNASGCATLTTLDCQGNKLTSLDVSGCAALTNLTCYDNQLTSLNVSGCTVLTELDCRNNQLTSLDVSSCTALTDLNCRRNGLTNLNTSSCTALTKLSCDNNILTSLDVSKNVALTELNFGTNQLTSLDVSKNVALTTLDCGSNSLTSLDVSKNVALTTLDCWWNQLTSLDVSKNVALTTLDCSSNLLRELNISGCNNLNMLQCYGNQIKGTEMEALVNSLPDRQGKEVGFFCVFSEWHRAVEGNACLATHVAAARAKNWMTLFYRKDEWRDYAGLDKPTFVVTYSSSNGGSISITGADDLENVPYDTELTVTETNVADGYKLTRLTANGQDILKTKRFKVTENTEVRAVFTLQEQELYYSVTPIKLGKGTIQVTGADDLNAVAPGTELTITATPDEGYELTELTANGRNILDTKKVVVNEDLIIKAVFKEKTYRVSLDRYGEGTLYVSGADDLDAVMPGTELTVTATPADTYELTELTANGKSILDTKKVVVNEDLIIKAIFSQKTFKVSLTKRGNGTIRAIGADNLNAVPYGTELTIVATPDEGSELTSLIAGGINIIETKKVTIKKETTIEAVFTTQSFAVKLTKEGEGTISAMGAEDLDAVAYGTELTINATPAEGYELTALTANGTNILASQKVTIKEAVEVKATFTKKNFVVTLEKAGEGELSTTGTDNLKKVPYGTELTIIATPAEGYELTSIVVDGVNITDSKKIVVKDNKTVKATFSKKSFAVSLTKEGEGTISATGASNLNSVAYGTELTINATPAAGYELTALTANGTDILATKKIVVTDNVTVNATFEKKTFAVTLTSNEHGEITIVEPVNLKAVPYGTTLTVKATGKNAQCVLTELTANGKDILATKSFVVTDVTEVKATFVDHTGVETTITQHMKLYPNPATDYVIVEGVAPASEVTLHSMTGERLYAGRADDRGTLQIDLTPYADGVYLVCVAGETYRVVVRH